VDISSDDGLNFVRAFSPSPDGVHLLAVSLHEHQRRSQLDRAWRGGGGGGGRPSWPPTSTLTPS
jgi:hypothetical protein